MNYNTNAGGPSSASSPVSLRAALICSVAAAAMVLARPGAGIARADSVSVTASRAQALAAPPATAPATAPAPPPVAEQKVQPEPLRPGFRANHIRAIGMMNGNPDEQQRQQIENMKKQYGSMPVGGSFKLADLLHIALIDGRFDISIDHNLTTNQRLGQQRIEIQGSKAIWSLMDQMSNGFSYLVRMDFDQTGDDQIWQTSVNVSRNSVRFQENGVKLMILYSQFGNQVQLQVYRRNGRAYQQVVAYLAEDLIKLQNDHPAAVRKYLEPMLQRLGAGALLRPGPGDVYGALTEIPADPKVTVEIEKLLPRLGADSFHEREAASHELSKLADPGILAALRIDDASLTAEQQARLQLFINTGRRRLMDQPAALAQDPEFLVECLRYDDPAVRIAAQHRLEAMLKKPIPFDVNVPANQRDEAVDALRVKIDADLSALQGDDASADKTDGDDDDNNDPKSNARANQGNGAGAPKAATQPATAPGFHNNMRRVPLQFRGQLQMNQQSGELPRAAAAPATKPAAADVSRK